MCFSMHKTKTFGRFEIEIMIKKDHENYCIEIILNTVIGNKRKFIYSSVVTLSENKYIDIKSIEITKTKNEEDKEFIIIKDTTNNIVINMIPLEVENYSNVIYK